MAAISRSSRRRLRVIAGGAQARKNLCSDEARPATLNERCATGQTAMAHRLPSPGNFARILKFFTHSAKHAARIGGTFRATLGLINALNFIRRSVFVKN